MRFPAIRTASWLALASLAACGPTGEGDAPVGTAVEASTTVCPATTVEGLDVSSAQGTIDWGAVQGSGRVFAIIKATQGDYYTNAHWQAQWDGAGAAGLMRSAYHFFDPTIDGVTQAQHFLTVVGTLGPNDLPPMLDIECPTSSDESQTQADCEYGGATPDSGWATAATINAGIKDWLDYVQKQTGLTPLIYSYNYWFSGAGVDSSALVPYPLVISWPTATKCYEVGLGNDFTSAAFWQWSVTGSCPGVTGEVDLDRFNGTLAQLQQLTAGAQSAGTGGSGGSGGAGGSASGSGAGGSSGTSGGADAGTGKTTGSGRSTSASAGSGATSSSGGGTSGKHGGCSCRVGEGARRRWGRWRCSGWRGWWWRGGAGGRAERREGGDGQRVPGFFLAGVVGGGGLGVVGVVGGGVVVATGRGERVVDVGRGRRSGIKKR